MSNIFLCREVRRLSIYEEDDLAYAGEIELYGTGKGRERILSPERNLGVLHEEARRKVDVESPAVDKRGEHGAPPREDSKRIMTRRSQQHAFRQLCHVPFKNTVSREKPLFRNHSPTGLRGKEEHAHHLPVPLENEKEQGEHENPQESRANDQRPAPHPYAEYEIQSIEHLHSRFVRIVL